MAGTITRGKILRADLSLWDGKTATHSRPDATGGTITGLRLGDSVDVLQVYGSGTDRTRATVKSATDYIASSAVTLNFSPGTWTIDSDLTIGANFTCRIPAGCVFSVSNGVTLTFSGDVIVEDEDAWYTGAGTVVVSRGSAHGAVWHRTSAERTAGVTPTNLGFPPGDVRRYGVDATGATDSTTALQNAVNVSEAAGGYNSTLLLPEGTIRIDGTVTMKQGTMIVGAGSQGSTLGYGTSIDHRSTGDCFVWNPQTGASNAGTGGGLKNVVIVKATGFSGGRAIYVVNYDNDHRCGEMVFENVLIYGTGTGMWSKCIFIDGSATNDVGNKGVRSVLFVKVRVATASSNSQYVHLTQVVHCYGTGLQIDTAGGSGTAGMTIDGDSENVNLSGLIINGECLINGNSTHVNLQGLINTLDVNNTSAIGSFEGSASVLANESKSFKIRCSIADAFAAKRTTSQANVTGDGTLVTVLYDSELYDKNASFDPTTGIFSAKCAGLYQFNAVVALSGLLSTHTSCEITIEHRNSGGSTQNTIAWTGNPYAIATPSGTASISLTCQLDLAYQDSVRVRARVSNGTLVVDLTGLSTTYNAFSGALL